MSRLAKVKGEVPSLKAFMMRGDVLSLYRSYVRATRNARWETIKWFRSEFERSRGETDLDTIKSQLQYGRMQLKQMQGGMMLHSSGEITRLRGSR
ncbi:hypothetical protein MCUN1_000064 [Malassezia cuniculi]|uniref:LYR motif-containing protein 2 n=1 Tax=Malassezia cuniculi TaxID=948313 RepID=A0AAF0ER07_9BASI|nr:hypothetical protein MCUN1_000064 [Malassezia cuniculi]